MVLINGKPAVESWCCLEVTPSISQRNSRSCRPFKALPTSWRLRGRLLYVLKSIGCSFQNCWIQRVFMGYLKISHTTSLKTSSPSSLEQILLDLCAVICLVHFLQATDFGPKEVRLAMYHDNVDHHVCDSKHCPRGDHTNHHQHQQHLDDNEGSEDVFFSIFIILKIKHDRWTSY